MARKVQVVLVGDAKGLERSLASGEASLSRFAKHGGGALREFSRAAGLAVGVLGSGALVAGIGRAVAAGEQLEVSQRQLNQQIRGTGTSVQAAAPFVDALDQRFTKFGDTATTVNQALAYTVRATGNVRSGLGLMSDAANLAAGRHISLQQAALVLGKVWDGNTSALKRLGVQIPKGVTSLQALAIVHRRFAGQAAAGSTVMGRFRAVISNLSARLGTVLLPTVNKLVTKFSDWLGKSRNQQKITHALATAVSVASKVVSGLSKAITTVKNAAGGWKNAFALVIGGLLALKMIAVVRAIGRIKTGLVNTGRQAVITSQMEQGASRKAAIAFAADMGTMEVATVGLSATIKSALISTGIGALMVAIGVAAGWVLTHWDTVKRYTIALANGMAATWGALKSTLIGIAKVIGGSMLTFLTLPIRGFLEAASHLPFVGGKFKKALAFVKQYTTGMVEDGAKQAAKGGSQIADAFGKAFQDALKKPASTTKSGKAIANHVKKALDSSTLGTGSSPDTGTTTTKHKKASTHAGAVATGGSILGFEMQKAFLKAQQQIALHPNAAGPERALLKLDQRALRYVDTLKPSQLAFRGLSAAALKHLTVEDKRRRVQTAMLAIEREKLSLDKQEMAAKKKLGLGGLGKVAIHTTSLLAGLNLPTAEKLALESRLAQAEAHKFMVPVGPVSNGIPVGGRETVDVVNVYIDGHKADSRHARAELVRHTNRNAGARNRGRDAGRTGGL